MTINYESFVPAAEPNLSLIIYSAATGSPSEEKLRILAERANDAAGTPIR